MLKDIIEKAREEYKEQFLPERIVANDPEKQYLADITLEIVEKNHLTFLEAKMREVAEATGEACKKGYAINRPDDTYKQFIGE